MRNLKSRFDKRFKEAVKDVGEIPENVKAKAAVTGVAGGAAAAGGSAATVAALGAASTGTAISTLSGAAATNATLAWFGGGSLAAGGAGVAGGLVTLATGGVAVAAAAGVGAYMYMVRKKKAKVKRAATVPLAYLQTIYQMATADENLADEEEKLLGEAASQSGFDMAAVRGGNPAPWGGIESSPLQEALVRDLLFMMYADEEVHDAERKLLIEVVDAFSMSDIECRRIDASVRQAVGWLSAQGGPSTPR